MSGHTLILESRRQDWQTEHDCASAAMALADCAALRDAIIELRGPLGAGKTSFVRHLLRALGVTGRVKSPSYALMESYALPGFDVWHFDFYRFDDPREWIDAGFRDVFSAAGLKLVEWPEKAEGVLPTADLRIGISVEGETARTAHVDALTPRGVELSAALGAERQGSACVAGRAA